MSQTTGKGLIYPESSDNARIWEWMQSLATSADAAIPGSVDVQVFTASGTWTRPAGALWVVVEVQGGGGGSGGCPATDSTHAACAGGGGGGEYARGIFTAAAVGTSQAVTVGAGGSGGAAGQNNGNSGGTSSFGSLITAVGGSGGLGGASTTSSTVTNGGLGGTGGTGGNLRVQGSDGGNGPVVSLVPIKVNNGGASFLAGQRRATTVLTGQSNGFDGYTYGGGAAGASNGAQTNSAASGGKGGDGVVIVTTYKA
ncbi:hypothetical protein AB0N14_13435 [Streptomyces sp. NPDC051104]|uniref:glycine-rich domain-containing protein n=1 Tax=Streptomyces sp. NPDC051104 TaxID=3155044 RepID=UPI0034493B09